VIRDRTTKDEAWLKIDTPTARALCVSAVALLAVALAGWLVLLSVLGELNARLDSLQTERLRQIDDFRVTILSLESKLEAVAIKLQRVEVLTQPSTLEAEARNRRLERLERELEQFRHQSDGGRELQDTPER
jgi:hypothetical protein